MYGPNYCLKGSLLLSAGWNIPRRVEAVNLITQLPHRLALFRRGTPLCLLKLILFYSNAIERWESELSGKAFRLSIAKLNNTKGMTNDMVPWAEWLHINLSFGESSRWHQKTASRTGQMRRIYCSLSWNIVVGLGETESPP